MPEVKEKTQDAPPETDAPRQAENDAAQAHGSAAEDGDRHARAESLIKTHAMASMAVGLAPVPALDVVAMVGNQVKMVHGLAGIYDVSFKEARVKSVIVALIGGSAPTAGVLGLSAVKMIPGIGTLVGSGGVSILGGATTYAVGRVFAHHFENGGDLVNLDVSTLRERFKFEWRKAKAAAEKTADETAPASA